jgi:hypothetical protein
MRYIFLFLALAPFSFAQPLSLGQSKEEKIHSSWLNLGFGVGVLTPIGKDNIGYKKQSEAFVNPAFLLGIQFAEMSAITFELDITAPNGGVGGWFGFEQQFMKTDIAPFAEFQVGARNPGRNKRQYNFGDAFGPAYSLNAGIIFFREHQTRFRLKGGYEMIINKDYDQSLNAEINVLFAFGRAGLQTIKVD